MSEWMTVVFENPSEEVWEAQRFLNKKGVYFDTGSGFHEDRIWRDWELDFSLEGMTTEEVIAYLDSIDIEYKKTKVRQAGYYSDGTKMEGY